MAREPISIWWFSGLLLFVYGILILAAGIWEVFRPLRNPPVLYELHASIWWGALLAAAGLYYLVHFRPGQSSRGGKRRDSRGETGRKS